jgi:hypothetical protein
VAEHLPSKYRPWVPSQKFVARQSTCDGEIPLAYPDGPQGPISEIRERLEALALLALKTEEVATSQGTQVTT